VTEVELVREDVYVKTGFPMQVGMTRTLRGHVDSLVRDISPPNQKIAYGSVLLFLRSEIDVGKNALSIFEEMKVVRALESISD
jgi:hypothetical protein